MSLLTLIQILLSSSLDYGYLNLNFCLIFLTLFFSSFFPKNGFCIVIPRAIIGNDLPMGYVIIKSGLYDIWAFEEETKRADYLIRNILRSRIVILDNERLISM